MRPQSAASTLLRHSPYVCRAGVLGVLGLVLLAGDAVAQSRGATVIATVRDPAGMPLEGAAATLAGHVGPSIRTNDEGRAAFVAVPVGHYRLNIIRAGYQPVSRVVEVDSDTSITVIMTPVANRLPEVQTRAPRTRGLIGKVGRARDWSPLAGATIIVYGGDTLQSDGTGTFGTRALEPGGYLVRIERDGFVPQFRSISMPNSGRLEMLFLLDSGSTPPMDSVLLAELDERQRWRAHLSAVIPRDELKRFGNMKLTNAVRSTPTFLHEGLTIDNSACVFVNGEPMPGFPVDAFPLDQIEAVEVYHASADWSQTLRMRWPTGQPCGAKYNPPPRFLSRSNIGSLRETPDQVAMVVIWLRPKSKPIPGAAETPHSRPPRR